MMRAGLEPVPDLAARVSELHSRLGNRAVGTLLQAKLRVSSPGDPYEREADRIADHIVGPPETVLQRSCAECTGADPCPRCQQERLVVQRMPAAPHAELSAPENVVATSGPGRPLDRHTQEFFESRFGCAFHDVRVHAGPEAARTAHALHARAFTAGRSIVFGRGEYAPATMAGRRLLAHELTHVLQQRAATAGGKPALVARWPAAPGRDVRETLPPVERRSFVQLWTEFDRLRWSPQGGDAANALVPDLIVRMSVDDSVRYAGELAVWLVDRGERELALRALDALESAWRVRYATGAVPMSISGGFGTPLGPENLVAAGEHEAAAGHEATARKLLGIAHLMTHMMLAAHRDQRAALEHAAETGGEIERFRLSLHQGLHGGDVQRLIALRMRILNVYPRLASAARGASDHERAARLAELGGELAQGIAARYSLAALGDLSSFVEVPARRPRTTAPVARPRTVPPVPAPPAAATAPPERAIAPDRVVEARPPFEGATALALHGNNYVFVRSERYAVSEVLSRATAWAQNLFGVNSSIVVGHGDPDGVIRYYAAALDADLSEALPAAGATGTVAVEVATRLEQLPNDYVIMVINVGDGLGFWPSEARKQAFDSITAREAARGRDVVTLAREQVRITVFSRVDALMAHESDNLEEIARLLSQLDATAFAALSSDERFRYVSVLLRAWTFQAQERAIVQIMRSIESETELRALVARLREAGLWEALIDDLDHELWSLLTTVGERFGTTELTVADVYRILVDNGLLQLGTPIPGLSIGANGPEFSIDVLAEIEEAANSFLRFVEGVWDSIVMLVTQPDKIVQGVAQLTKMIVVFQLADLGYPPAMVMRMQILQQFGRQLLNGFKGMAVLGVGREVTRRVRWAIIWEIASFFVGVGEIRAALAAFGLGARVGAVTRFIRLLGLAGRASEAEQAATRLTRLSGLLARSGRVLRTEEEVLVALSHLPDEEAAQVARVIREADIGEDMTLAGLRAAHPELADVAQSSLRRAEALHTLAAKAGGYSDDVAIAFARVSRGGHAPDDLARIVSHIPDGEGGRFVAMLRMVGDDLALTGPRGLRTLEVLAGSTRRMQAVERFGFRAIDTLMERSARTGPGLDRYLDALAGIERDLPAASRATSMQRLIDDVAAGDADALARVDARAGRGTTERGLPRTTDEPAEPAPRRDVAPAAGVTGRPVPGLPGCRLGSVHCPITYLADEFPELFAQRESAEFARYIHPGLDEYDLVMRRSLRREMTILTGDAMYAQYLREVPRRQWSEPFREAVDLARRPGIDHRLIPVGRRQMAWPLDDIGAPWVVHHDPPLGWTSLSEGAHLWHPMPYRIHDAAHSWWNDLERFLRGRVRRRGVDMNEQFDIRFF